MGKKYQRLGYKKAAQQRNKNISHLRTLMKKYNVEQWLVLLRYLNTLGSSFNTLHRKAEILTVVADLALRLSPQGSYSASFPPSEDDVKKAFNIYISCEEHTHQLIKKMGVGSVPLIATYQNRFSYVPNNVLGRMHLLYQTYETDVVEGVGLSIKEIYLIVMAILGTINKTPSGQVHPSQFYDSNISGFTNDKVDSFFAYFSNTPSGYIERAKQMKIYENDFGRFNFLNQYPFIKLENGQHLLPVNEQLIDTVSTSLYNHIHTVYRKRGSRASENYLNEFGKVFEDYVLSYPIGIYGQSNVIRADDIVTDGNRCEAIVLHNNKALAIEVKKLNFKMNAIAEADVEHIDQVFERHLVKGFSQIENTYKYIEQDIKYGLIVIPDCMMGLSAIKDYLRKKFPDPNITYDNSVTICPLSSYEALMSNSSDVIFEVLERILIRQNHEGDDPSMVLHDLKNEGREVSFMNKKCTDACSEVLSLISTQNN